VIWSHNSGFGERAYICSGCCATLIRYACIHRNDVTAAHTQICPRYMRRHTRARCNKLHTTPRAQMALSHFIFTTKESSASLYIVRGAHARARLPHRDQKGSALCNPLFTNRKLPIAIIQISCIWFVCSMDWKCDSRARFVKIKCERARVKWECAVVIGIKTWYGMVADARAGRCKCTHFVESARVR